MDAQGAKAVLRLAAGLQTEADDMGLQASARPVPTSSATHIDNFDALVTDLGLRTTVERLYRDGHYAQAVEEGCKYLNNLVKQRAGNPADQRGPLDGQKLMTTVFSVDAPILRLSDLASQSKRDQQIGYMQLMAGIMMGIRNPRAHEHRYLDEPDAALELLVMVNHLVRVVSNSSRTRRQRVRPATARGGGTPHVR